MLANNEMFLLSSDSLFHSQQKLRINLIWNEKEHFANSDPDPKPLSELANFLKRLKKPQIYFTIFLKPFKNKPFDDAFMNQQTILDPTI